MNDVNIDNFVKLNYQTCNVCVDGCDEWILIKRIIYPMGLDLGKGQ